MSMILIPSYGLIAPPPALVCAILQAAALGLEDLGARRRLQLTGHGHGGENPHPHVERALEPDEGAEMRQTAGQLGAVQEHRERALERAAARDDRVDDRLVLGSDLVLAGDWGQPCHGFLLLSVHCSVSPASHSNAY